MSDDAARLAATLCWALAPSTVACLGDGADVLLAAFEALGVPPASPAAAALTVLDDGGALESSALAAATGTVVLRVGDASRLRAWVKAWLALGYRRRTDHALPGFAVLYRAEDDGWIEEYEHALSASMRERDASHLVLVETHARLLEAERRFWHASLYSHTKARAKHEASTLLWEVRHCLDPSKKQRALRELIESLVELRRRWAPTDSLRTRALDITFATVTAGQRRLMQLFDLRDTLLVRVRGPRP
ncbi:MAG: hypothetical protein ABI321_02610 [Polyangia bacterium]